MLKKIVAVTACPTGIAHTFMASEKLELVAKKLGIDIKVETRGQAGAQNVLTESDILEAAGVIIASDIKVDMERFVGKQVINVSVREAIYQPEELFKKILAGKGKIHENNVPLETANHGQEIYKHIMNGISHMIPFVVAGGILVALSFLFDYKNVGETSYGIGNPISMFLNQTGIMAIGFMLPVMAGYIAYSIADRPGLVVGFVGGYLSAHPIVFDYEIWNRKIGAVPSGFLGAILAGIISGYVVLGIKRIFKFLPKSLDGIKPILLYPLLGVLIISVLMIVVNFFMSPINVGLNNILNNLSGVNAILLGLFLGGMMAIDMGGPFNKTAYAFGTASLLNAQNISTSSTVMASVMTGGMVPPLGIALATTLFPNKFNKQQREAGKGNYVMGLTFITEGAIPFAASNPKAVVPAILTGASIAGALSMAFQVSVPAPHGGIFLLPVIKGWYYYLLALLSGTIVTTLILSITLPTLDKEWDEKYD